MQGSRDLLYPSVPSGDPQPAKTGFSSRQAMTPLSSPMAATPTASLTPIRMRVVPEPASPFSSHSPCGGPALLGARAQTDPVRTEGRRKPRVLWLPLECQDPICGQPRRALSLLTRQLRDGEAAARRMHGTAT